MLELTEATISELAHESEVLAQRTLTVTDPAELSTIAASIHEIKKELEMRSMIRDSQQRERRKRIL